MIWFFKHKTGIFQLFYFAADDDAYFLEKEEFWGINGNESDSLA